MKIQLSKDFQFVGEMELDMASSANVDNINHYSFLLYEINLEDNPSKKPLYFC